MVVSPDDKSSREGETAKTYVKYRVVIIESTSKNVSRSFRRLFVP